MASQQDCSLVPKRFVLYYIGYIWAPHNDCLLACCSFHTLLSLLWIKALFQPLTYCFFSNCCAASKDKEEAQKLQPANKTQSDELWCCGMQTHAFSVCKAFVHADINTAWRWPPPSIQCGVAGLGDAWICSYGAGGLHDRTVLEERTGSTFDPMCLHIISMQTVVSCLSAWNLLQYPCLYANCDDMSAFLQPIWCIPWFQATYQASLRICQWANLTINLYDVVPVSILHMTDAHDWCTWLPQHGFLQRSQHDGDLLARAWSEFHQGPLYQGLGLKPFRLQPSVCNMK